MVLLEDRINELCRGTDRCFCSYTAANYFIRCSMLVAFVLRMNEKGRIQESFEGVSGVSYRKRRVSADWMKASESLSLWSTPLFFPGLSYGTARPDFGLTCPKSDT